MERLGWALLVGTTAAGGCLLGLGKPVQNNQVLTVSIAIGMGAICATVYLRWASHRSFKEVSETKVIGELNRQDEPPDDPWAATYYK